MDPTIAGFGCSPAPSLCQMTSSVFGGIAARNVGYAVAEVAQELGMTARAVRMTPRRHAIDAARFR